MPNHLTPADSDPADGTLVFHEQADGRKVSRLAGGNYDVAFLWSGDSGFERAVDLLRARGKRVYVVSARAQLSRELAHIADEPIFYLDDLQQPLARNRRFELPAQTTR